MLRSKNHFALSCLVLAALLVPAPVFAGIGTLVQSVGASGDTPTPTDNDYTRINDALQAASDGDTIHLQGVFDWSEANAAASWELGSDGTAATGDDWTILVTPVNNVTLTAASLGAATIMGPGDVPGVDLEGCLYLLTDSGTALYQGWEISNLQFDGFDFSIGMFYSGGSVDAFDDVVIQNNFIRIPADIPAADETFQNIGLHFSFGSDQLISGNVFEIAGDASSDTGGSGVFSASVAMQSNTSGGSVYDGLVIEDNEVHIVGAQPADPSFIVGIWENGHAHTSNVTVQNNLFMNLSEDNDPALNIQRAFRVTTHSSATTTSLYEGNRVYGANIGFSWLTYSTPINFMDREPVIVTANEFVGNDTGVIVRSNGNGLFRCNRFFGNAIGLENANPDPGVITDADADENWWACNDGPDMGDCDTTVGTVVAPTWLQLTAEAADSSLTPGEMTAVDVTLTQTSADVAASCDMPDGIPTAYDATGGTMSPLDGSLVSGVDQSTFTAGTMDGLHAAFVALDAELLAAAIDIDASETDLSVTVTSTPEQAAPSEPITFTALVENLGPSDAPGAIFDFPIPTSATSCTWTCTSSAGAFCGASGSDDIVDTFDLPAGSELTYEMTCTYDPVPSTLKSVGCGAAIVDSWMTDLVGANNDDCSIVYSIFDDVFTDGFESGDTSAWSATVP